MLKPLVHPSTLRNMVRSLLRHAGGIRWNHVHRLFLSDDTEIYAHFPGESPSDADPVTTTLVKYQGKTVMSWINGKMIAFSCQEKWQRDLIEFYNSKYAVIEKSIARKEKLKLIIQRRKAESGEQAL